MGRVCDYGATGNLGQNKTKQSTVFPALLKEAPSFLVARTIQPTRKAANASPTISFTLSPPPPMGHCQLSLAPVLFHHLPACSSFPGAWVGPPHSLVFHPFRITPLMGAEESFTFVSILWMYIYRESLLFSSYFVTFLLLRYLGPSCQSRTSATRVTWMAPLQPTRLLILPTVERTCQVHSSGAVFALLTNFSVSQGS